VEKGAKVTSSMPGMTPAIIAMACDRAFFTLLCAIGNGAAGKTAQI
jgi:hypothetical protein